MEITRKVEGFYAFVGPSTSFRVDGLCWPIALCTSLYNWAGSCNIITRVIILFHTLT